MADLTELTVESLSQLSLSEIPKPWVDEVWQTDFCEFCELPVVLEEALDRKKYFSEELKCVLNIVEEWSKCEADSQPLGQFVAVVLCFWCFVWGSKCLSLCLKVEGWEYCVQIAIDLK